MASIRIANILFGARAHWALTDDAVPILTGCNFTRWDMNIDD